MKYFFIAYGYELWTFVSYIFICTVLSGIQMSTSMMTWSNRNIFRVTGLLWWESAGRRWIPLTKTSDADLWCFLWFVPEQTAGKTIETLGIQYTIALIMTSLKWAAKHKQLSDKNEENNGTEEIGLVGLVPPLVLLTSAPFLHSLQDVLDLSFI